MRLFSFKIGALSCKSACVSTYSGYDVDFLKPFVISSCFLMAWWIMAMHGYALLPDSFSRIVLLILSSAVLSVQGLIFNRQKRKLSALFTWSFAWACWAFFAEQKLLLIPESAAYASSLTIYNLFRYFLIVAVFVILIKQWALALRGIGRN